MFKAKDILIKPIDSKSSNACVRQFHYSGKIVPNSQIHFGVFMNGVLHGALQFGPSTDKRRMAQNLGIGFNEFLELNRMAFSDFLPKNSESRAIGYCLRILKKKYTQLKLIVSFADACQCGDGTIYRASGFKLINIKKNSSLLSLSSEAMAEVRKYIPSVAQVVSDKSLNHIIARKSLNHQITSGGSYLTSIAKKLGAKPVDGFQMKYLYFFDKELEKKYKFINFQDIPDSVKMYKGIKRTEQYSNASVYQTEEGGATPTCALHLKDDDGKT